MITLHRLHLVGVCKAADAVPAVFRDPGPLVIAVAFDDQRVAFPVADGIAQPSRRRRIVRQLAAVHPDIAPRMSPFKELQHAVRQHHKLHAVVVGEQPRISQRIANQHTVFRIRRRNVRFGRVEHLLAFRRERRNVLHIQFHAVVAPDARQILRIEGMPLDLIGLVGQGQLLVIGAPRAGLPTRSRSEFFFRLRFGRFASEAFALSLSFPL